MCCSGWTRALRRSRSRAIAPPSSRGLEAVPRIVVTLAMLGSLLAGSVTGTPAGGRGIGDARVAAAAAPVHWEHQGFTIPAWGPNDLYNSGPALDQFAAGGGSSVAFMMTWYTRDIWDTEI